MTPQIKTRIDIEAPSETVWRVLTDLEGYASWNPFVVRARGKVAKGEVLVCEPQMPGGRRYTFRPTIVRCVPGREFAWSDHVVHPLLGAGEHSFRLEPLDDARTRLDHDELFTGLFSPLVVRVAGAQTTRGFELMNEATKREAERRWRSGGGT